MQIYINKKNIAIKINHLFTYKTLAITTIHSSLLDIIKIKYLPFAYITLASHQNSQTALYYAETHKITLEFRENEPEITNSL